ncbi:hypothetical protein [Actinacidiphila oryziradicis]|jgi:hypothetical protein|uniref:Uncharacterized protein n=1 Tax=Actinacidiphila oryziradicis TaxID=2571141 RepID=A0A4U0RX04_9ACTN|nr:hypothetical protein [Actinacidiphila oryziradicis]MDX6362608.1 hypothetical protein [Streptomyces sp.]TKA00856.1 hypothetical protein FCI23_41500 [Actinacidiphila oryziradicis]
MDRISFTVLLTTAADTVTTAGNILPTSPTDLTGVIGRAVLGTLLPAWRRPRVKARSRKNPTTKYGPNAGQHPQTAQTYIFQADIMFFEHGLACRARC